MTSDDKTQSDRSAGEHDAACVNFKFAVIIGETEIGICNVSRLHSETVDASEHQGGSEKPAPLVHRYPNVILKRALTSCRYLYDWRELIVAGTLDKRSVTIRHFDRTGDELVHSWDLLGAWPCRWSGPEFDAVAGDLAFEEVELRYDRLAWR